MLYHALITVMEQTIQGAKYATCSDVVELPPHFDEQEVYHEQFNIACDSRDLDYRSAVTLLWLLSPLVGPAE